MKLNLMLKQNYEGIKNFKRDDKNVCEYQCLPKNSTD